MKSVLSMATFDPPVTGDLDSAFNQTALNMAALIRTNQQTKHND